MKLEIRSSFLKFAWMLAALFIQILAVAQDSSSTTIKTHTTTTTETETWYTQPWVWIVGGAVFILLLIALIRGGGGTNSKRTDRVTVTKTSSTDV